MAQSISQEAIGATGLPGATAASRYAGATASGAPTTGTFAVGDLVVDQSGYTYVCYTAGTPGLWSLIGGTPQYVTGSWYPYPLGGAVYQMVNNVPTARPFLVTRTHTFTKIGVNTSTSPGSAGSVARLAIYNDNGSSYPGSLIADYGTVATTTASSVLSITIPSGGVTLQPGLYWLTYVSQGSPATAPTMWCDFGSPILGSGTANIQNYYAGSSGGYIVPSSSITGAMPSTFPSGGIIGQTATTTLAAFVVMQA